MRDARHGGLPLICGQLLVPSARRSHCRSVVLLLPSVPVRSPSSAACPRAGDGGRGSGWALLVATTSPRPAAPTIRPAAARGSSLACRTQVRLPALSDASLVAPQSQSAVGPRFSWAEGYGAWRTLPCGWRRVGAACSLSQSWGEPMSRTRLMKRMGHVCVRVVVRRRLLSRSSTSERAVVPRLHCEHTVEITVE